MNDRFSHKDLGLITRGTEVLNPEWLGRKRKCNFWAMLIGCPWHKQSMKRHSIGTNEGHGQSARVMTWLYLYALALDTPLRNTRLNDKFLRESMSELEFLFNTHYQCQESIPAKKMKWVRIPRWAGLFLLIFFLLSFIPGVSLTRSLKEVHLFLGCCEVRGKN